MKRLLFFALNILALTSCSTMHQNQGHRAVSSLEKSKFTCDNGSQEVTPAEQFIPIGDNLYYPIKNRIKPYISFGAKYRNSRPRHRQGVLRPHAVFKSAEPQEVRAIHSGEIQSIYVWQGSTFTVSVKSADGHITRYAGLDRKTIEKGVEGWFNAGDTIGFTAKPFGRTPHHFLYIEVYSGEDTGRMTKIRKGKCFNRRDDVLDPNQWLEQIEAITFGPRSV